MLTAWSIPLTVVRVILVSVAQSQSENIQGDCQGKERKFGEGAVSAPMTTGVGFHDFRDQSPDLIPHKVVFVDVHSGVSLRIVCSFVVLP